MSRAAMGRYARGVWLAAFGTSIACSRHAFTQNNPRVPFESISPPMREMLCAEFETLATETADAAAAAFLKLTPFAASPRKTG